MRACSSETCYTFQTALKIERERDPCTNCLSASLSPTARTSLLLDIRNYLTWAFSDSELSPNAFVHRSFRTWWISFRTSSYWVLIEADSEEDHKVYGNGKRRLPSMTNLAARKRVSAFTRGDTKAHASEQTGMTTTYSWTTIWIIGSFGTWLRTIRYSDPERDRVLSSTGSAICLRDPEGTLAVDTAFAILILLAGISAIFDRGAAVGLPSTAENVHRSDSSYANGNTPTTTSRRTPSIWSWRASVTTWARGIRRWQEVTAEWRSFAFATVIILQWRPCSCAFALTIESRAETPSANLKPIRTVSPQSNV